MKTFCESWNEESTNDYDKSIYEVLEGYDKDIVIIGRVIQKDNLN